MIHLAAIIAASVALAPHGPADMTTTRAQAIAAAAWGNPCGGQVQIDRAPLPPNINAEADIPNCRVIIAAPFIGDWGAYCTTMVHEYGHLAGYGHSLNPRSVMAQGVRRTWKFCMPRRYWHGWALYPLLTVARFAPYLGTAR